MALSLRIPMVVAFLGASAAALTSLTACPIATAGIYDSYMSIDGERRRSTFFTDSTNIICTAEVRAGRTNSTLEMIVRQTQSLTLDRKAKNENLVLAYADFQGAGKQTLELKPSERRDAGSSEANQKLQQAAVKPFPAGSFRCEIYLDGKLEDTLQFVVDYAPCPPQRIQNGAQCGGFYEANRVCPGGGQGLPEGGGPPEPTTGGKCTCEGSAAAVWVCQ